MKLDRVIAVRSTKTVYRDGELCIKVYTEGYKKSDVFNEALNQARIEETGLKIPSIKEVVNVDGKWAIVSQYIEGKSLGALMEEHPENKKEYMERFVNLQIEVHELTCPHLNKLKDKLNEKLLLCDLNATKRYELKTKLDNMPKHKKICHGDFNPSNIVIDKDDNAYILDWSHATVGNASGDVATTYLLFKLGADDETAEMYLDMFCEKTGTEREYVLKWIPIAAATLSVRCRTAEDKQKMLDMADVEDYK